MGTYNCSDFEIITAIEEALDNLQGDFTQKTLNRCLNFCKNYPYVCDTKLNEKLWQKAKRGLTE